ncbi:MAG: RNA polymerase sigma factor [Bacteroidales bacterium]|nr:RNA polymerase sigma factor [Bacteroidales bacterium]
MRPDADKEERFAAITREYKDVIAKVCCLYSSPTSPFDDLFQEVLINIWLGLDSFRAEAKLSTWIYRAALNTCISWHRRNSKHRQSDTLRLDDIGFDLPDKSPANEKLEQYQELLKLIAQLSPIDKALITLWLDEKSYSEIGTIMGMTSGNVAVKIHRIKDKLSKMAEA